MIATGWPVDHNFALPFARAGHLNGGDYISRPVSQFAFAFKSNGKGEGLIFLQELTACSFQKVTVNLLKQAKPFDKNVEPVIGRENIDRVTSARDRQLRWSQPSILGMGLFDHLPRQITDGRIKNWYEIGSKPG